MESVKYSKIFQFLQISFLDFVKVALVDNSLFDIKPLVRPEQEHMVFLKRVRRVVNEEKQNYIFWQTKVPLNSK